MNKQSFRQSSIGWIGEIVHEEKFTSTFSSQLALMNVTASNKTDKKGRTSKGRLLLITTKCTVIVNRQRILWNTAASWFPHTKYPAIFLPVRFAAVYGMRANMHSYVQCAYDRIYKNIRYSQHLHRYLYFEIESVRWINTSKHIRLTTTNCQSY